MPSGLKSLTSLTSLKSLISPTSQKSLKSQRSLKGLTSQSVAQVLGCCVKRRQPFCRDIPLCVMRRTLRVSVRTYRNILSLFTQSCHLPSDVILRERSDRRISPRSGGPPCNHRKYYFNDNLSTILYQGSNLD